MTEPKVTLERLRVLLVEDQPYMRQIIRQTLERLGVHNVYEAEDGGEALKMTVRLRPDIVLCDVHMEPVNGVDYLAKLRAFKNAEIAQTPVVFLTADAGETTVMQGKKNRVNGYIVKPTSAGKLIENINRLLGPVIPAR
jgi:two-component system chemotaxis response regulator CheY